MRSIRNSPLIVVKSKRFLEYYVQYWSRLLNAQNLFRMFIEDPIKSLFSKSDAVLSGVLLE